MNSLYVAWRVAIKRVWRVPWTTHFNLLLHITGHMPPELYFDKRAISFIKLLFKSKNQTVKMITGMGLFSRYSFIGKNYRYLTAKYELDAKYVLTVWNNICVDQEYCIRLSEQIKDLCSIRDSYQPYLLNKTQRKVLIDHMCTE